MIARVIVDLSQRPGGTQRRIAALLHATPPSDRFYVVCLRDSAVAPLLPTDRVSITELGRKRWDPRLLVDLIRTFRRLGAEVVDAHNVVAQFWAPPAARVARVANVVCTVHSNYAAEHAGSGRGRWYPRVLKLAALCHAKFIAVDGSVAAFLRAQGISERQLVIVPNGPVRLDVTPLARQTIRARHRAADRFVVLFAGRLEPVKDVETLLAAFANPELKALDARLWIAGEGSCRTALEARARALGVLDRVNFLGQIADVPAHMDAADCVALVSRSEGLPYVVLEAINRSRPMILTKVGSFEALLGDDGACFVDVGDSHAVASALAHLASNPVSRAALADRARQRLDERLSERSMYDATVAFYGEPTRPRRLGRSLARTVSRPAATATRFTLRATPAPRTTQRLDVVTYHRVSLDDADAMLDPVLRSALPAQFELQMALLASRFHPVSIDDVVRSLDGDAALPPRAVLVTFDDAYADLYTHALPALRRHRIPAVIFVPTAYPGNESIDFWWDRLYRALLHSKRASATTPVGVFALDRTPSRASLVANAIARHAKTLRHDDAMQLVDELVETVGGAPPHNGVLSWSQLAAFAENGVDIESHTRTHAALDQLPAEAVRRELAGSMIDIEARIGRRPVALAYPTGQRSPEVRTAVEGAGYSAGFTTRAGTNFVATADRLELRRLDVNRSVTAAELEVRLGLGGLLVDRRRR